MSAVSKFAAGGMVVAAFLFFSGVIPEIVALPAMVLAGYVVHRERGGIWQAAIAGLVGGAVAGLLVLGPGFRLAMRAVALMDPVHPEEFTVGGTLFIVIGIGGVMGGITAMTVNVLRRALDISSAVLAGALMAVLLMVDLVFFSGDISDEILQLGISPWLNIPLFGLVSLGYGIAAMAIADWVGTAMFRRRGPIAVEKVRA